MGVSMPGLSDPNDLIPIGNLGKGSGMTDALQFFRDYLEQSHIEQLVAQVDRAQTAAVSESRG